MRLGRCSWSTLGRAAGLSVLAVGILFWGASAMGIRLNSSPSLPVGVYQVTSDPGATLIEFCPAEPFA